MLLILYNRIMLLQHPIEALAFILHELQSLGPLCPVHGTGVSLRVALFSYLSWTQVEGFSFQLLLKQSILRILVHRILWCLTLRLHLDLVLHQRHDVLNVLGLLLHVDLLNLVESLALVDLFDGRLGEHVLRFLDLEDVLDGHRFFNLKFDMLTVVVAVVAATAPLLGKHTRLFFDHVDRLSAAGADEALG